MLLGQHGFAERASWPRALNKRVPDDVMVYGLLTDANVELGDYAEAEKACQWMLNLRPGQCARADARARICASCSATSSGALELMTMALDPGALRRERRTGPGS